MITIIDKEKDTIWGIYHKVFKIWKTNKDECMYASNCKEVIEAQLSCIDNEPLDFGPDYDGKIHPWEIKSIFEPELH